MVDFQKTHQNFQDWLRTPEFRNYFIALFGRPAKWQMYAGILLICTIMGIPMGLWLIWKWRGERNAWLEAVKNAPLAYADSQIILCAIVTCDRELLQKQSAGAHAVLVGSFAPYSDELAKELVTVSEKLKALHGQDAAEVEPTLRKACEVINDEPFQHERRRSVPRAITGNTSLILFEAFLDADFWGTKPVDFPFVVCIAEPREEGSIQQVPDRVVAWTV